MTTRPPTLLEVISIHEISTFLQNAGKVPSLGEITDPAACPLYAAKVTREAATAGSCRLSAGRTQNA
ncbi:hypothetical protein EVAR_29089_1 [Eumeta japonica]|uniref:Uncharacterized protein n=1 Tax=Eumeta variegata TaxID=151549 RepID=A0A4C1VNX3_EUMVA|nr:hypothetical protein EVAR_29089_1 [Eumeta japonica]